MAFIGIDLGTTYSCVAVYLDGRAEVLENDHGTRTTPSYVAFTENEAIVGNEAKYNVAVDPKNTVFETKRLIGRTFDDSLVQRDINLWPFEVTVQETKPRITVMYQNIECHYFAEEISAMILTKLKEIACNTKENTMKNVLVFDLGGGTFDVSILSIVNQTITVKAVNGNTHLGGSDFDCRLVDHFVEEIKRKYNIDITKSQYKSSIAKLRTECELAKKSLSARLEAKIAIACLFENTDFRSSITRAKFENICDDLFQLTLCPVAIALNDAKLKKDDIEQ